ncbi:hypothetical protein [Roseivirga pacifica]|uniref:hypothetical protein n=1 Tax=Roseivirga pacifica TaxID=1267423 RepID=UPI0020958817|nr:hypothetical protein [Roseivirga pacifica]MCO6357722.1 hypothetical protein [Roseivirga pacifica]MCO6365975.1 hypothetical protein [Roseivirga pacifica]MCO6371303.1 hypothetical protein [Roseivirga pacifica]MCO6375526.1 hypothetical protein [Roseivirga pacifica]MCO6378681.1 hypothetical protein [Roseivirga pacifica]
MDKSIIETYPNAWDFGNSDKQMKSTIGDYRVEYGELLEIAMGTPLGGQAYLVSDDKNLLIDNWCSGPPIWDSEGKKVAIPKWTRTLWRGTLQQLIVIDLSTGKKTTFKRKFNVLDLRSFEQNKIYGYDSPRHKPKMIEFDVDQEKIETKNKITIAKKSYKKG